MNTIQKAIADCLIENGKPVLAKEYSYEWADYSAKSHAAGYSSSDVIEPCLWIAPEILELEEVCVSVSVIDESSTDKMIQARGFTCSCDKYKNVTMRFDGSSAEFLLFLSKM